MVSNNGAKAEYYGFWAFKAIIALALLFFGGLKFVSAPMLVQEFNVIGLSQGFRYFTGLEAGRAVTGNAGLGNQAIRFFVD